jgi:hypothetical protein
LEEPPRLHGGYAALPGYQPTNRRCRRFSDSALLQHEVGFGSWFVKTLPRGDQVVVVIGIWGFSTPTGAIGI